MVAPSKAAGAGLTTPQAFIRSFLFAATIKGLFNILPPLMKRTAPSAEAVQDTLKLGLFLGAYSGTIKALQPLMPRTIPNAALIGAMAALFLKIASPSDQRLFAYYMSVRGADALIKALAQTGIMPSWMVAKHPEVIVMFFINAILLYCMLYDKDCAPAGYKSTGESLAGVAPDTLSQVLTTPGSSKEYCQQLHPNQSCAAHAVRERGWGAFRAAFMLYAPFFAIPAVIKIISILRGTATAETGTALEAITGAVWSNTRSAASMGAMAILLHASQCSLHRKGFRNIESCSSGGKRVVAASAAGISGAGIIVETPDFRMSTALFTAPRALQGLVALSRKYHILDDLRELEQGPLIVFMLSSAALTACYSADIGLSSIMKSLLGMLWG